MRGDRYPGPEGPAVMDGQRLPCGIADDGPAEDFWKNEISCTVVGCKNCKNFNGTIYYEANAAKAVSLWAQHEIEVGRNGIF